MWLAWLQAELETKVKMLCLPIDILAHTATQGNTVGTLAIAGCPPHRMATVVALAVAPCAAWGVLSCACSTPSSFACVPHTPSACLPAHLQALQEPLGVALGVLEEVEAFRQSLVLQDVMRVGCWCSWCGWMLWLMRGALGGGGLPWCLSLVAPVVVGWWVAVTVLELK